MQSGWLHRIVLLILTPMAKQRHGSEDDRVDRRSAPDAETAIAKAIDEFKIEPASDGAGWRERWN